MKKIAIFALTIMLFTACRKDINEMGLNARLQAELVSKTNAQNVQVSRPIRVDFYSTVDLASPTLNCSMPGVPFAITNSGYFLHGNATHLGLINGETSMGLDGSCNLNPATFILSTTTTGRIVSANGDMITYTGSDAIDLNNVIFHGGTTAAITGVWTITGGTGRFAGATGSFSINGIVDLTTAGGPTFSITGDGTITY
ncbi:MAG: hypothetical protein ABIO79_13740 [Ferruginibacter sp.]